MAFQMAEGVLVPADQLGGSTMDQEAASPNQTRVQPAGLEAAEQGQTLHHQLEAWTASVEPK